MFILRVTSLLPSVLGDSLEGCDSGHCLEAPPESRRQRQQPLKGAQVHGLSSMWSL